MLLNECLGVVVKESESWQDDCALNHLCKPLDHTTTSDRVSPSTIHTMVYFICFINSGTLRATVSVIYSTNCVFGLVTLFPLYCPSIAYNSKFHVLLDIGKSFSKLSGYEINWHIILMQVSKCRPSTQLLLNDLSKWLWGKKLQMYLFYITYYSKWFCCSNTEFQLSFSVSECTCYYMCL